MSAGIKKVVKENLKTYFESKGKSEKEINQLFSYLSDRLIVVSLIETAKFGGYPFKWLTADQKEFLEKGGEDWLANYLDIEYPVYSRDPSYSDLSFVYILKEINKIIEKLDIQIDLSEITPAAVDRFFRIKIVPESYRNFKYIFTPVLILYGLNNGYFSQLNKKDKNMAARLAVSFLTRFLNEFINKAKGNKAEEIDIDTLNLIETILRKVGDYDSIIGKLYTLKKTVKSFERKTSRQANNEVDENLKLLQEALKIIKKQLFPNFNKAFEERTGVDLYNLTYKLRKKYISRKEYEKLKEAINRIKEDSYLKEAGELFEKVLESKKVKGKEVKQLNAGKLEVDEHEKKKIEEALKSLQKSGIINKNLSKEDEERFKKALIALSKLSYMEDLSDFASFRLYI